MRYQPVAATAVTLLLLFSVAQAADAPSRARQLTYDPRTKEWVEIPPPPPGTAAGDLHLVRLKIEQERYRTALSGVDRLIKTYGTADPVYPEALLVKAEALIGLREYDRAHDTLQAFLNEFGGMALTEEALRLEFVTAEAYLKGAKRRFLWIPLLPGEELAFQILDEVSIDYAESRLAELAIKAKGDYLFAKGDFSLAEMEYARMLKDYPLSRYHQFALRRTADAALASHGGVDYDEASLIEAEERYREYRARYPGAAEREGVGLVLGRIREQRAEKEYSTGQYYERTAHTSSAVFYYQAVCRNWPDTIAAGKARQRLDLLGAAEAVTMTTPASEARLACAGETVRTK